MADIVTLTPNPAIDLSTAVDRIVPFRKLRCAEPKRDPGGGGINVARVLRRWNSDTLAIFPAGGPTGMLLTRLVDGEGIPRKVVEISDDTREDFTVFETQSGRQYRFVLPGPILSDDAWHACCGVIAELDPRPRFVVASGSLPPDAHPSAYARIAKAARAIGAKPVIDTSGEPLKYALDEGVFLVKPNLRELTELAGRTLDEFPAQLAACRELVTSGKAAVVALTLAEQGAIAVTAEGAWRAFAPQVRPVSTVGAGDSFLGTMLWRIALGHDVGDSLRYGVAAGTAALLAPGTDLCRPQDVETLLPQVSLEKIRGD